MADAVEFSLGSCCELGVFPLPQQCQQPLMMCTGFGGFWGGPGGGFCFSLTKITTFDLACNSIGLLEMRIGVSLAEPELGMSKVALAMGLGGGSGPGRAVALPFGDDLNWNNF